MCVRYSIYKHITYILHKFSSLSPFLFSLFSLFYHFHSERHSLSFHHIRRTPTKYQFTVPLSATRIQCTLALALLFFVCSWYIFLHRRLCAPLSSVVCFPTTANNFAVINSLTVSRPIVTPLNERIGDLLRSLSSILFWCFFGHCRRSIYDIMHDVSPTGTSYMLQLYTICHKDIVPYERTNADERESNL